MSNFSSGYFFNTNSISPVKKVGINGGTVTTLASGLSYESTGFAVDSESIYFNDSGSIKKVPKDADTTTATGSHPDFSIDNTPSYD